MCYNHASVKYLIIADIHSNLEALEAVLEDAQNHGGFGHVWCLGDIVGYGPDPRACLALLKQLDPLCVCGNHDQAAVGKIDIGDFNSDAAIANRWTAQQLADEEEAFLTGLPEVVVEGDFTLAHGSPRFPLWEYVAHIFTANDVFNYFHTTYCLVGHTHVPLVFEQDGPLVNEGYMKNGDMLVLGDKRLIINPGGVGQPRDRDARASYAIYDLEKQEIRHYRVSYDIETTQTKMKEAGLPGFLSSRLSWGV